MYKSRLQELCHMRSWNLPEYSTTKEGLDHMPLFLTTVTVNGEPFVTRVPARSSNLSQNDAAQIAFERLSASKPMMAENVEHFYQNQLQIFAQKRNLALPVYTCEREGPIHSSRFRCKVEIDGKTYDAVEFFRSIKEAEQAAAKVALSSLSKSDVKECGFLMYKNILQEFCQKKGYKLPVYRTSRSGEVHRPTFISIVEISGESFTEQRGSTKKMAEMHAAKVAYTILKERKASQNSTPQHSLLRGQSTSYFASQSVSSATASNLIGHQSKKPRLCPETASLKKFSQNLHESIKAIQSNEISMTTKDDAAMKDMQHLNKYELQTLAQRRNPALPTRTCELRGNRFKRKVVIDELKTFQSTEQAEHAAAKLALSMSAIGFSEVQGDSIMYKNLLQEFTQKQGYNLPKYTTEMCGGNLMQAFISTVEVNEESFTGLGGRTKKLAEMNAAKVAYSILKERMPSRVAVIKSSGHHTSSSSMNRDNLIITPKNSITAGGLILSSSPCRPKQDAGMEFQINNDMVASGTGDCRIPLPCDLTGLPPNVIRIYPQSMKTKFPENNMVLSDEEWVAVSSDPMNQSI